MKHTQAGLDDKQMLNGRPTVYVCENFACKKPLTAQADLANLLGSL